MLEILLSLLAAAPAAPAIAVIGLDDMGAAAPAVHEAIAATPGALSQEEILERLTGSRELRAPNIDALRAMLADAREREARFDTAGANALRTEILKAFDSATVETVALRDVAAAAAQDIAAALVAEGNNSGAELLAREALRRFASVPLDPTRHSPAVHAVFDAAREKLAAGQFGELVVETDATGTVLLDGNDLGEVERRLTTRVPGGRYRLWLLDPDGNTSIPRSVEVGESGATVKIGVRLELRLLFSPVVGLRCPGECVEDLLDIGERLGVDELLALPPPGSGRPRLAVRLAEGVVEELPPVPRGTSVEASNTDLRSAPRAAFTPLYLVPFGVGQFSQDRPVFGGAYAAVEAGLLALHLITWHRHASLSKEDVYDNEPDLRLQRNVSLVLFYSSLVANVAEALIVGWVTGQ